MSSQDDILELQEQITKALADNGDLAKCKADLRAKIYKVLKNEKNLENNHTLMTTESGRMSLAVIYDFLDYYDFAYTKQVFSTETNTNPDQFEEKQKKMSNAKEPILFQLLKSSLNHTVEDDLKTNDRSLSQ